MEYGREEAIDQFRRLVEGGTPEFLGQCMTCVACNQFCEKGANPFDLMLQRMEETGVLAIPEQNVQLFRNLPNTPSEVIPGDEDKPALSLCSVGGLLGELFEGPLFEGLTVLKGGDYFCNVGWIHLGAETPVREGARRVVENIAGAGKEEVVFFHDDCYALFASMVKEYGIETPFKPIHIIEYLLRYVKNNRDRVKPLDMRIAYQQPCASRYTPWKDEQLDELFGIIGVERVKRKYDRLWALCCGSPMMPRNREKAMVFKERNIQDAKEHGAEAMAYLCPLCVLNLRKVADAAGLKNYHIIELVRMATGG
jgi:hypothetical protein